ncbi:aspartate/glutamate racemase family protein [Kaistella sp. G5-32]|uniref:Aspartate/glutamate racemase family protein n=1 Tax=Kaistella gelatinilytica TaxID=2787636 RepID=A0ABS0FE72_9FLAO|nr:aspartate/glutamate racemase family protein [Kaistella gelatinilytica]MBF8457967.1 aspartate/glutamate racemase family protein [Kaistella gelatinilytica]
MIIDSSLRGVLGLGNASTEYYLKRIHEKYRKNKKEFSTCPLLLYQSDFQEINPYLPDQFSVLIPKLENYFSKILDFGISKLLVPNITLHETLDQMKLPFEIFHPIDLTLKYLKENSISEVTLFGTFYTMNSEYLDARFQKEGISLLKPIESDQKWIDDFRKKIYNKEESPSEINIFQNLIKKYSSGNPVIIGCTELSLFAFKENSSCIDMAELQIEEFLK